MTSHTALNSAMKTDGLGEANLCTHAHKYKEIEKERLVCNSEIRSHSGLGVNGALRVTLLVHFTGRGSNKWRVNYKLHSRSVRKQICGS